MTREASNPHCRVGFGFDRTGFSVPQRIYFGPHDSRDRGPHWAGSGRRDAVPGASLAGMAPQDSVSTFVSRVLWLPGVAGLFLAACSSDATDAQNSTDSGATHGTTSGNTSSGATTGGSGPTGNGTSMGAGPTVGSSSTGSATTGIGPTATSTVGTSSSASSSSSGGTATTGAGGANTTGDSTAQSSGGTATTGAGGTGGGVTECTRDLLSSSLDAYFVALEAGDPAALPLAAGVKFTENAAESEIGTTDFWMNAGAVKHVQSALDTEECTVAAHAVVPEGTTDLPIAVRIKLEGGEMSEIETIVVRPGDYTASFAVDSNPGAIIAIADEVGWDEVVPEGDERATRERLTSWINKYFRFFPQGVCNVTGDCTRLENGGGSFSCGAGASCNPGEPGPNDDNLVPRLILADVERGIVVGLTILEGHLDMHMAKMYGGEVHAVQAILRDTDGQSGWD